MEKKKKKKDALSSCTSSNIMIPSEQDRKALLGCLSYILGVLYNSKCHQQQEQRTCRASSSTSLGSLMNHDMRNDVTDTNDDTAQEEYENGISSRRSLVAAHRISGDELNKKRSFGKYVLTVAVDLLGLDSTNAIAFSVPLNANDAIISDRDNDPQAFIWPYLSSFSSEKAAFQCIALLLTRFLLYSSTASSSPAAATKSSISITSSSEYSNSVVGYDARIRVIFKTLAVLILSHFQTILSSSTSSFWASSTRTFEAMEHYVSVSLIAFASQQQQKQQTNTPMMRVPSTTSRKDKVIRGLKVGGAGLAAGALFALTGGIAAPALAAGVAAVASGTVVASIVGMALSSVIAVTTVFGVSGGGLVAAKMLKRTEGLSEFNLRQHPDAHNNTSSLDQQQLSRCVCISGWLRDTLDFHRPWGVTVTSTLNTTVDDSQQFSAEELLLRFYSVYAPDVAPECSLILEQWTGREAKLWEALTEKYGRNPTTLLPLYGPARQAAADFVTVNFDSNSNKKVWLDEILANLGIQNTQIDDGSSKEEEEDICNNDSSAKSASAINNSTTAPPNEPSSNSPLAAWDFHAQYSCELYTVKWESNLLMQLNSSVKDLAKSIASNATSEVLKYTALTGIVSAVALPVGLLQICNMIDGPWTLAIERSDEAGKELAVSLLESHAAGHRPISLIGYSFGARVIYACLVELARHQKIWEDHNRREQHKMCKNDNREIEERSFLKNNKTVDTGKSEKKGSEEFDVNNYNPSHYYREPASIVEDVILMGCPVSLHLRDFARCRQLVAGRLVNCYVPNDMMLRLMFRYKQSTLSGLFRSPCGAVPVSIEGVEDYDVSQFVTWHSDYCFATRSILSLIGHGQPMLVPYHSIGCSTSVRKLSSFEVTGEDNA